MSENATFSKKERLMLLGLNLDSWNNILLSFLAVAALAAAIVGWATYATIQLAEQEAADAKKEYEEYKLTVEGKVAEAKREGIEAGKAAGNALVRAAELEKDAANARLETEKIKSVVQCGARSPRPKMQISKVCCRPNPDQ